MALGPADQSASLILGEREGAQRDALIELDVVADLRGLADDYAGGVIDEEVPADGRAGVDVHAGDAVGPFGHDARNERHAELVQLVREAIHGHREHAGV